MFDGMSCEVDRMSGGERVPVQVNVSEVVEQRKNITSARCIFMISSDLIHN